MKVEVESKEAEFKPVRITFTLETQDELNTLGSLFDTAWIADVLDDIVGDGEWGKIWETFRDAGADLSSDYHDNKFDRNEK